MKDCPHCHLRYPADALFCFLDGARLVQIRDPLVGATVAGRYVIEDVIGQGGMATVYRARHKLVERPCAIKAMNRAFAADSTVRERFRREAKSAQMLAHPNIIEIYDLGETADGTPFMVMELLDGETLAQLMHRGALPVTRSIPILIQLARGIARAHDLGVVHRDLKPENAFVSRRPDGSDLVKILDFGIARASGDPRLTNAGELFGTPLYIAPERVNTGEAGPSVDLYALGVIFYEAVTGKLPFEATDPTALLVKHIQERPPPPRTVDPLIHPNLDALVMQLLEKDPRDRPVDAHRVVQDLVALARTLGAPVPPDAENDPESSRPPAYALPAPGMEPPQEWAARLGVFDLMRKRSAGPWPAEVERALVEMRELVAELAEARRSVAVEQRALDEIDARGREGLQRFGFAVDALGLDASRARDEFRAAQIDFDRLAHQSKRAAASYAAAHRELIAWEARSGAEEPHPQLAEAHRSCARSVDEWIASRRGERSARSTLDEKGSTVSDLDYQLGEMRAALANHELGIDRERGLARERLADRNGRVERIEERLVALATSFCEPLRGRSELRPFFQRLERGAA